MALLLTPLNDTVQCSIILIHLLKGSEYIKFTKDSKVYNNIAISLHLWQCYLKNSKAKLKFLQIKLFKSPSLERWLKLLSA